MVKYFSKVIKANESREIFIHVSYKRYFCVINNPSIQVSKLPKKKNPITFLEITIFSHSIQYFA